MSTIDITLYLDEQLIVVVCVKYRLIFFWNFRICAKNASWRRWRPTERPLRSPRSTENPSRPLAKLQGVSLPLRTWESYTGCLWSVIPMNKSSNDSKKVSIIEKDLLPKLKAWLCNSKFLTVVYLLQFQMNSQQWRGFAIRKSFSCAKGPPSQQLTVLDWLVCQRKRCLLVTKPLKPLYFSRK